MRERDRDDKLAGGPSGGTRSAQRLGLPTATAMIAGTIIGVGVFNLPTSLSDYGPISIVSPTR